MIEVTALTKRYGPTTAVDSLTFDPDLHDAPIPACAHPAEARADGISPHAHTLEPRTAPDRGS